ncbi:MAG: Rab family GTPase [Candidatus Hodarchaeales archaeon]|jgi:Ras-related protein Rab-11A
MVPERIGKVKIVLIGDERVGKTTLRKQYMGQKQTVTYMATIGADFAKRDTKITISKDDKDKDYIVESLIWDLAGQDAYKIVRESFYEGASGAMLVLDITRRETLENATKWIEELWENTGRNFDIPFLILANKTDARDSEDTPTISIEETKKEVSRIQKFATSKATNLDIKYLETSALTGVNVNEAFETLLREILKDHTI